MEKEKIELIAFLGNPGAEYERNRHNAGRLLADKLPFLAGAQWQKKYKSLYAGFDGSKGKIHCIKPETFMNLSGEAVQSAAAFFKIPAERVLIVHDELDLAQGQARFKFSGGLNGHNGLRSIKACLNTPDFWRLRIGIGRPSSVSVYDWVLSDFSAAELSVLENTLLAASDALTDALARGTELPVDWTPPKQ
jgi:PTH1 family peptidyl-tRNA hydrolase